MPDCICLSLRNPRDIFWQDFLRVKKTSQYFQDLMKLCLVFSKDKKSKKMWVITSLILIMSNINAVNMEKRLYGKRGFTKPANLHQYLRIITKSWKSTFQNLILPNLLAGENLNKMPPLTGFVPNHLKFSPWFLQVFLVTFQKFSLTIF